MDNLDGLLQQVVPELIPRGEWSLTAARVATGPEGAVLTFSAGKRGHLCVRGAIQKGAALLPRPCLESFRQPVEIQTRDRTPQQIASAIERRVLRPYWARRRAGAAIMARSQALTAQVASLLGGEVTCVDDDFLVTASLPTGVNVHVRIESRHGTVSLRLEEVPGAAVAPLLSHLLSPGGQP
jgi:hypothetical protein